MPTYSLKRFASPDALRGVSLGSLLRFLSPYTKFLERRGLNIDESDHDEDSFDYSSLVGILISPDKDTPKELVDALYYVHEMATTEGMDFLLIEAERRGIALELENPTPIDVAMRMWVEGGDIVEFAHARESMSKPRVYVYFQPQGAADLPAPMLDSGTLDLLQADLDEWYMLRQRGRGARVFLFERDEETWFLIRHGEPFKREGVMDDGKSSCVFYRPERYDIVVYNSRLGDIRIHATTKGEVELYQTLFGRRLFGDGRYFPNTNKYTLEPLRADMEASLVCSDIPGIESITLAELEFEKGGLHQNLIRWKSSDIFDMLRSNGEQIPAWARFSKAVFKVVFSESRRPRIVCIRPPNIALFQRDGDGKLIEEWLEARGFTCPVNRGVEDEGQEELLVAV